MVLKNVEDLKRKKKMLQRILLSTVACMYAVASREPFGWGCKWLIS